MALNYYAGRAKPMKTKSPINVRWNKPEMNWYKLNTDGSAMRNPERSPRTAQHQRFGANSLSRDGQSSINHNHNHRPLSHRPRRRPLQPPIST
ncbi:hypothetical protein CMV_019745 [Castanea mollissima]|uniref:Uncharacterized protein n=1 Tax=Castanea mollissima TaxID=60419 RepID=A0A8J4VEA4_9ROSI|nr:hypothetical protein CMV_019745 [Castanea mollissima]